MNGREIFDQALRLMNEEEGSQVVQNLLNTLDLIGTGHVPDAKGVSEEFLENLERVDVATLPKGSECPICTNLFVDNDYPLVVRLPCHLQENSKRDHMFDMDCIAPWLIMNATCPMCRFNVHDAERLKRERLDKEVLSSAPNGALAGNGGQQPSVPGAHKEANDEDDDDEDDDRDLYG